MRWWWGSNGISAGLGGSGCRAQVHKELPNRPRALGESCSRAPMEGFKGRPSPLESRPPAVLDRVQRRIIWLGPLADSLLVAQRLQQIPQRRSVRERVEPDDCGRVFVVAYETGRREGGATVAPCDDFDFLEQGDLGQYASDCRRTIAISEEGIAQASPGRCATRIERSFVPD